MNPTEQFFESRIHTTHTILGRRLRALCLLDLLALEAAESPFVRGGPVGVTDVAIAVNLLSRPIQRNLSIDAGFANPGFFLKLRAGIAGMRGLEKTVSKIEAYISDYMTSPELWRSGSGDSTPLGAHWIQTLAVFLLRETNLTQTEIWTNPIGQILWISASVEEQLTQSRVKTEQDVSAEKTAEDEAENMEKMRQVEIKMLREEIANGAAGTDLARAQKRLQKLLG